MKKEIKLTDALNKEFTGYSFSYQTSQVVLVFGDEFSTLEVDSGYKPGEEEIVESQVGLFDFGEDLLVAAGVVTKKEMYELREKRAAELKLAHETEKERWDMAEYERLSFKYGSKA